MTGCPVAHEGPCEKLVRVEERIATVAREVGGHTSWLLRLDGAYQGLSLETAREIAVLKTKLLVVSAVGALAGSCLGAVASGLAVFYLTK